MSTSALSPHQFFLPRYLNPSPPRTLSSAADRPPTVRTPTGAGTGKDLRCGTVPQTHVEHGADQGLVAHQHGPVSAVGRGIGGGLRLGCNLKCNAGGHRGHALGVPGGFRGELVLRGCCACCTFRCTRAHQGVLSSNPGCGRSDHAEPSQALGCPRRARSPVPGDRQGVVTAPNPQGMQ